MAELKPFNTEIDRIKRDAAVKAKIEADLLARLNGPKIAYTREGIEELGRVVQNSLNEIQINFNATFNDNVDVTTKESMNTNSNTPRKNKFQPGDLVTLKRPCAEATRTVISVRGDVVEYQNSLDEKGTTTLADESELELVSPAASEKPTPFATYGFYDDAPDINRIFEENPGAQVIEVNGKIWVHRDRAEYVKRYFGLWNDGEHEGHQPLNLTTLTLADILEALHNRTHFTVKAYR